MGPLPVSIVAERQASNYCLGTKVDGYPCTKNKERYTRKYQDLHEHIHFQHALNPHSPGHSTDPKDVLRLEFCHLHKPQGLLLMELVKHVAKDPSAARTFTPDQVFGKNSLPLMTDQPLALRLAHVKPNVRYLYLDIVYAQQRVQMAEDGLDVGATDDEITTRAPSPAPSTMVDTTEPDEQNPSVSSNEEEESEIVAGRRGQRGALRSTPSIVPLAARATNSLPTAARMNRSRSVSMIPATPTPTRILPSTSPAPASVLSSSKGPRRRRQNPSNEVAHSADVKTLVETIVQHVLHDLDANKILRDMESKCDQYFDSLQAYDELLQKLDNEIDPSTTTHQKSQHHTRDVKQDPSPVGVRFQDEEELPHGAPRSSGRHHAFVEAYRDV